MDKYRSGFKEMVLIFFLTLLHLKFSAALQCRCFPGEACWPTSADWTNLNSSVDGRLIATIPIGSPCHDPTYDAARCLAIQEKWFDPSEQ